MNYYAPSDKYEGDVRRLAHQMKGENIDGSKISVNAKMRAIRKAARLMALSAPKGVTLVPIPSRNGNATDTLLLANEISKITGNKVQDVLKSPQRKSSYETKKSGGSMTNDDFGFYFTKHPKGNVLYVDNVLSSGATLKAANDLHKGSALVLSSVHDVEGMSRVGTNKPQSLIVG